MGACAELGREAAQIEISGESVGFRGGPDRLGVLPGSMDIQPVEAWSFDTGNHVISSPVPLERGIVVVGGDGVLRRVDSEGSSEWTFDLGEA